MRKTESTFSTDDKTPLFFYRFAPDGDAVPKAIVHVSHGMAEHAARYERFAEALTRAGYLVYVNDHRGHGKTAQRDEDLGYFADHDGFDRAVRDLVELIASERRANPGLDVFLFGHSMGSYLAQEYAIEHGS